MELTDYAWPVLSIEDGKWYIFVLRDGVIIQKHYGPYDSHSDACESIQTMSYRMRQGWAP